MSCGIPPGRGQSIGQREVQFEPVSQVLDLAADRCGHGLGERVVLVDRMDPQDARSRSAAASSFPASRSP